MSTTQRTLKLFNYNETRGKRHFFKCVQITIVATKNFPYVALNINLKFLKNSKFPYFKMHHSSL
jgi:hypothetical protein